MALAFTAAAVLLAAAVDTDPFGLAPAVAASLGLVAGVAACGSFRREPVEVGVDRDGALVVRRCADPEALPEQGLQCVFAAPWLITLRRGTMCVPIWPDSVPGNTYRRLWVYIRWSSGRRPADLPAESAAGHSE